MWQSTTSSHKGVLVDGDFAVPPTRWWNHWWLLWFGWRKIATFRVPSIPESGYFVGYRDFKGTSKIQMREPLFYPGFSVRIGFEACTFFAVNKHGYEVTIELIWESGETHLGFDYRNFPML